ncbi:hypothetical protein ABIF64_005874 [Bradyrhizobium japonicum]|uniref:head-tail connector protein n=1 Tax=Bradyrhizobium japonicum TaxID=375 RepID=UPI00339A0654
MLKMIDVIADEDDRPVTLEQLKKHVQAADFDDDDEQLEMLLDAAIDFVANRTALTLRRSTWRVDRCDWWSGCLNVLLTPVRDVTIKYLDGAGATQTVDAALFSLVNGGSGISTFTVVADKFQIQLPAYNGGAPVPVFTVGTLNGVPATGLSGNLYLDGTFNVKAIAAGSIDVIYLKANSIDSASGVIKALGVQSLSIGDNAVTVPVVQTLGSNVAGAGFGNWVSFFSFNMSIDTTGLSGKTIVVYVNVNSMFASGSPATETGQFRLLLNGAQVNYYQVALPTGQSALTPLSGAVAITGTGGNVSISIAAQIGVASSCGILAGATIFAMAAKR